MEKIRQIIIKVEEVFLLEEMVEEAEVDMQDEETVEEVILEEVEEEEAMVEDNEMVEEAAFKTVKCSHNLLKICHVLKNQFTCTKLRLPSTPQY